MQIKDAITQSNVKILGDPMEFVMKLVEMFLPLIIEEIKIHHPGKSDEEHKQIAHDIVSKAINK